MPSNVTYESPLEELQKLSLRQLQALRPGAVIKILYASVKRQEWLLPVCFPSDDDGGISWTHASIGEDDQALCGYFLLSKEAMDERPAPWLKNASSITFHDNMEVIPVLKCD